MDLFLYAHPQPGATGCIVVGPRPASLPGEYEEVLWCVHPSEPSPSPAPQGRWTRLPADSGVDPAEAIDAFLLRHPRGVPALFVTRGITARAAWYEPVLAAVHQVVESYQRARVTRQRDAFTWQRHVLKNLKTFAARPVPPNWAGSCAGTPAFIVGAGPSLDVSGPVLARCAGAGVVLCADSSVRALQRLGIEPDVVVSIDAAKVPEKCLPEGFAPRRVVLSGVSPPQWLQWIPRERTCFVGGRQLTLDWLQSFGLPGAPVTVTESCGSTALDLARFLGCAPLYLFGLDMAADAANPGKRHHGDVERSLYSASGYNAAQKQPLVPGNYADRVPTFMIGDWRALDDRVAAWPAGLVVNVNDRGARLRNAILAHPSTFSPPDGPPLAKESLLPLPPADAPPPAALASAEQEAIRVGGRLLAAAPVLRAALDPLNAPALARDLARLLQEPHVGHVLGAYSLKLMPALLPPHSSDPQEWTALVDEMLELAHLAAELGSSGGSAPA